MWQPANKITGSFTICDSNILFYVIDVIILFLNNLITHPSIFCYHSFTASWGRAIAEKKKQKTCIGNEGPKWILHVLHFWGKCNVIPQIKLHNKSWSQYFQSINPLCFLLVLSFVPLPYPTSKSWTMLWLCIRHIYLQKRHRKKKSAIKCNTVQIWGVLHAIKKKKNEALERRIYVQTNRTKY